MVELLCEKNSCSFSSALCGKFLASNLSFCSRNFSVSVFGREVSYYIQITIYIFITENCAMESQDVQQTNFEGQVSECKIY